MEEASVFAPIGNDEVFERVEPLDSQGGTSRAYLVCVNGQQFFMKQLKAEYVSNPRYRVMFMKEFCNMVLNFHSNHYKTYRIERFRVGN